MTHFELNLIGVPEIILDQQPVAFARRGSIALLAYLALSRRPHPREALATLLAGDTSEDQARKYLSNVLVDLRQHVGDYVRATRQTVVFDRTLPFRIDAEEFCGLLEAGIVSDEQEGVQHAIDLYRGEFLAGLSLTGAPDFDVWLFAQREELRGRYMQALRLQVQKSLRQGAWLSGIAPARRLIAEEPWMEEAHRDLMLMLAHSGQRQAAIAQYHTCRRVLREELDIEPMAETTALFKRMRAALSPTRHNLPVPSTPMVGRRDEMRLLLGSLADPGCQLVTITGMAGSGKTRLALEVARAFASPVTTPAEQPFADGIVFVPLAEHASDGSAPDEILLSAIASALELPHQSCASRYRESVATYLKDREVLIVLDNLEDLSAGACEIQHILRQAPHTKVLGTSRAPLHLDCERVLHMDGLRLPDDPDDIETADASALFLQEAQRVQVGFALHDSQRKHLVTLCRQLGGFPLAMLLAARWAPVLPCSEILRELDEGIDVLATPEPDLPERHRSVRDILDNTLSQLTTEERALAQRLADAPPDADASQVEMDTDDGTQRTPAEVLSGLRSLSEQALICVDATRGVTRLHPLLSCYVRSTKRGRRGRVRVA